jgi:hypothetical protein
MPCLLEANAKHEFTSQSRIKKVSPLNNIGIPVQNLLDLVLFSMIHNKVENLSYFMNDNLL